LHRLNRRLVASCGGGCPRVHSKQQVLRFYVR
jgi:hypothetical protein